MSKACGNLKNYLAFELKILSDYLKRKEPYTHEEKQELVADFIKKHGNLMRRVYCSVECPKKSECEIKSARQQ